MATSPAKPIIGTVIGDPAGIGPEIVARALATGRVHELSRPLLIGSAAAMERALDMTGIKARVRKVSAPDDLSDDPLVFDIFDSGAIAAADLPLGEDTARAGVAVGRWLDEAHAMASKGDIGAMVMGPISSVSFKLAGIKANTVSPTPGESYLVLFSGPLRVAHVTDHMPLRNVSATLTPELILDALTRLSKAMKDWGVPRQRIVVAGFNPHATGDEDRDALAPGVERARALGIDAVGPISPDLVFRQCIEGTYDMVLAMYHDQGHIAIKTWGFSGNCAMILGPPYLFLTIAHGTAFDIVGKGLADPAMILTSMRTAGSLAAGRGFPQD